MFAIPFWSLYSQIASAWVVQAESMDRKWLGVDWYPSQIQFINPVLILSMIPIFYYVIYPIVNKVIRVTSLRKISVGLFMMAAAFVISALIQGAISGGQVVSVTSQSQNEQWSAENVLKGKEGGPGWQSAKTRQSRR